MAREHVSQKKEAKAKFVECGEGELRINTLTKDGKTLARMVWIACL